jgi:hypothetical protein
MLPASRGAFAGHPQLMSSHTSSIMSLCRMPCSVST